MVSARCSVQVIAVIVIVAGALQAWVSPRFADYEVKRVYTGVRAKPKVPPDQIEAKGYRQVLTDADKRTNFAGKYVVSEDSCGTNSVMVMITGAQSGEVFGPYCFFYTYQSYGGRYSRLPVGVDYRRSSRLLVAHGCLDGDTACGNRYYLMTDKGLVLQFHDPFRPPVHDR